MTGVEENREIRNANIIMTRPSPSPSAQSSESESIGQSDKGIRSVQNILIPGFKGQTYDSLYSVENYLKNIGKGQFQFAEEKEEKERIKKFYLEELLARVKKFSLIMGDFESMMRNCPFIYQLGILPLSGLDARGKDYDLNDFQIKAFIPRKEISSNELHPNLQPLLQKRQNSVSISFTGFPRTPKRKVSEGIFRDIKVCKRETFTEPYEERVFALVHIFKREKEKEGPFIWDGLARWTSTSSTSAFGKFHRVRLAHRADNNDPLREPMDDDNFIWTKETQKRSEMTKKLKALLFDPAHDVHDNSKSCYRHEYLVCVSLHDTSGGLIRDLSKGAFGKPCVTYTQPIQFESQKRKAVSDISSIRSKRAYIDHSGPPLLPLSNPIRFLNTAYGIEKEQDPVRPFYPAQPILKRVPTPRSIRPDEPTVQFIDHAYTPQSISTIGTEATIVSPYNSSIRNNSDGHSSFTSTKDVAPYEGNRSVRTHDYTAYLPYIGGCQERELYRVEPFRKILSDQNRVVQGALIRSVAIWMGNLHQSIQVHLKGRRLATNDVPEALANVFETGISLIEDMEFWNSVKVAQDKLDKEYSQPKGLKSVQIISADGSTGILARLNFLISTFKKLPCQSLAIKPLIPGYSRVLLDSIYILREEANSTRYQLRFEDDDEGSKGRVPWTFWQLPLAYYGADLILNGYLRISELQSVLIPSYEKGRKLSSQNEEDPSKSNRSMHMVLANFDMADEELQDLSQDDLPWSSEQLFTFYLSFHAFLISNLIQEIASGRMMQIQKIIPLLTQSEKFINHPPESLESLWNTETYHLPPLSI